jgi:uncharacterized membrane protein YgcG
MIGWFVGVFQLMISTAVRQRSAPRLSDPSVLQLRPMSMSMVPFIRASERSMSILGAVASPIWRHQHHHHSRIGVASSTRTYVNIDSTSDWRNFSSNAATGSSGRGASQPSSSSGGGGANNATPDDPNVLQKVQRVLKHFMAGSKQLWTNFQSSRALVAKYDISHVSSPIL